MAYTLDDLIHTVNGARYTAGQIQGHYESFFLRANHPSRPLAFWIRYTIFSPDRRPADALGELWAIVFNGETGEHHAAKTEHPISACHFGRDSLSVRVGDSTLGRGQLKGHAESAGIHISWDLTFSGDERPLLLLPGKLYGTRLPKAKSLVPLPMATFHGTMTVNGETLAIQDWAGSQNHNWGSKHTDYYAWGQVAGFDDHPDTFLEVATAQIKIGPIWTPALTLLTLRHRGREMTTKTLWQAFRAKGHFTVGTWRFVSESSEFWVEGTIRTDNANFIGLSYYNPPGGTKHCLNCKIASCELTVRDKRTGIVEALSSKHRAAFEILTDAKDHGIAIRV